MMFVKRNISFYRCSINRLLLLVSTPLLFLMFTAAGFGGSLLSDYQIVLADSYIESEEYAADELADYIGQCTNTTISVISESNYSSGNAIFVGQTDYADNQNIDFSTLGQEEWIIRSVGSNLIITGGRPRGTLYGAYQFLESVCGIRFLAVNTEYVPVNTSLEMPTLNIQKSPTFIERDIYTVTSGAPGGFWDFFTKRQITFTGHDAKYGASNLYGSPGMIHTFQDYSVGFPASYFALLEDGTTRSTGNICLSNSSVRAEFKTKLRAYIAADRASMTYHPTHYTICPDDNHIYCHCSNCQTLMNQYGGKYSGALLDFVNDVAGDIAGDFPEITVVTFAYSYYIEPPQNINPDNNVFVKVAILGSEFTAASPQHDTLRSINHSINAAPLDILEDWNTLAGDIGIHDYWVPYRQQFQWPHAYVTGLADRMQEYNNNDVKMLFTENLIWGTRLANFVDLRVYFTAKLMEDPTLTPSNVISEFMTLYYGAAAAKMTSLLNYMEQRQEEDLGYLGTVPPFERAYFDYTFFTTASGLLDDAEALVASDPVKLANVKQERLAFDECGLFLWDQLGLGQAFDYQTVYNRLSTSYTASNTKYGAYPPYALADTERLNYLSKHPALPDGFTLGATVDLCCPMLNLGGRFLVDDDDACTGKAYSVDDNYSHSSDPVFGLSGDDGFRKTILKSEIPTDEDYHLYYIGRMSAGNHLSTFWAHSSWVLFDRLRMVYNSGLDTQHAYDIYASIKFQGPSYVSSSTKDDAFLIDRIILARVNKPALWWKLNEGTGTMGYDEMGTGNDMHILNGTSWDDNGIDVVGSCLSYNGTTNYSGCYDDPSLQLTEDLTVSMWVYPTDVGKSRQNFIDKNHQGEFSLTMNTDGSLMYYHGNGSTWWGTAVFPAGTFQNDKWYHIAIARNAFPSQEEEQDDEEKDDYNLENLSFLQMGKSIINARRSIYKINLENKSDKTEEIAKINNKISSKTSKTIEKLMKQAVKQEKKLILLSNVLDNHQGEIDSIKQLLDENDFEGASDLYTTFKKVVKGEYKIALKSGIVIIKTPVVSAPDEPKGTIKSYLNGQYIGSWIYNISPSISTSNFLVGKGYAGYFAGKIDNLKLFSNVLRAEEIMDEYYTRKSPFAWWKLDEGTGTDTADEIESGNDGTLVNGCTWDSSGKSGNCVTFDGSNDYINCGNDSSLQLTGDLTIAMWVYPTDVSGSRQNVIDKYYQGEFSLTMGIGGALTYYHGNGSSWWNATIYNNGTFQNNTWYHLVVVRDAATQTVKSYLDGQYINSFTYNKLPAASSNSLLIGTGYAGYFSGKIDDVRIYTKALSDDDISSLWSSY